MVFHCGDDRSSGGCSKGTSRDVEERSSICSPGQPSCSFVGHSGNCYLGSWYRSQLSTFQRCEIRPARKTTLRTSRPLGASLDPKSKAGLRPRHLELAASRRLAPSLLLQICCRVHRRPLDSHRRPTAAAVTGRVGLRKLLQHVGSTTDFGSRLRARRRSGRPTTKNHPEP